MTAKKKLAETTSFSDQYKDPRWQKKRLEIMGRDLFTCQRCGDNTKTLHVHHAYYEKNRKVWDYPNYTLVTLCNDCHKHNHFIFNLLSKEVTESPLWMFDVVEQLARICAVKGQNSYEMEIIQNILSSLCNMIDAEGE